MVYLLTVAILLIFIYIFEIWKIGSKKQGESCYYMVMLWFIALSGFSYNVGSDTVTYMLEYERAVWRSIHSIKDFLNFEEARQPGWLLLEFSCRELSSNFVFFKLIISAFGNWTIFRFIRKHSSYPFISVLFYGLIFALHLNFNALRQFVAVGFFLLGYDYLINKKWLKYYFFVFLAFMFHSTAIICACFPILLLFGLNRRRIFILGLGIVIGAFYLLSLDITTILGDIFFANEDFLSDEVMSRVDIYFGDDIEGGSWSLFGMIRVAFFTTIYMLILYLNLTKKKTINLDNSLYLLFIFFYVLNFCVPIVFFRFLFFVQPCFVCILANSMQKSLNRIQILKPVLSLFVIVVLSLEPISNLFTVSTRTNVSLIVQYNPYYSVFNPQIDPIRNKLYGAYRK